MPKYICLDKELDISKYQQLKSIQEGFEIVYDNGWSQLGSPYPLDINQTETYHCFDKISRSIHKTRLKRDQDEMAFDWVYDVGQINDVYLALALSETNVNLIIDISFEELEEVSDQVEIFSDKYEASDLIKGSIGDMLDQINGYGDKLQGEIDLEELSNFSGYEYDLQRIMRNSQRDIYDALIEYQHIPTA